MDTRAAHKVLLLRPVQAARELARDHVLYDPTDDDIVLAAYELAHGSWPSGGVDRDFAARIVEAYDDEAEAVRLGVPKK